MHSLLSKSNLLTAITLTLLLINDVHSYPTPGKTIAIPINHAAADSWNPSKIEREPVPKGPDYDIHTNFGFDGIPIKLFNDTSVSSSSFTQWFNRS